MRTHKFLYDFGISQDDPATELKTLHLSKDDRVLCVASGGEIPLELLVNSEESVKIDAVDISELQLYLSNLKLKATMELEGTEAAGFLGYLPADQPDRRYWFDRIKRLLPEEEVQFWTENDRIFEKGPIQYGRYETYIAHFAPIGRWLLGGREKVMGMFDCTNVEQQTAYFDDELKTRRLKVLFKVMFNRRLYSNRGVSEHGLLHMDKRQTGVRFFHKFREFCTNTPARENWYLQFMLFNRVLFEDALPDYLQTKGRQRVIAESSRLRFIKQTYTDRLKESPPGYYNKFAFSNISDWLTGNDIMYLMDLVARKAGLNANGLIRYIHSSGINPQALNKRIKLDPDIGERLLQVDRFPFYNLIPFKITGTAGDKEQ